MKLNKKANVGPIGAILLFIVFIVMWFVWLGGWVNKVGVDMVNTNSLTGFEAFFFYNLNLVIMLGLILGTLGFMYWSSGQ
jgi:hypothetical protein